MSAAAHRQALVLTLVAAALGPLARSAPAQLIDHETWSQLIVDHPLERKGDVDRLLRSWLDLIDEEPDHPLVAATLGMLRRRFAACAHPAALAERVLDLDDDEMLPAARRELGLAKAMVRLLFAPTESLGDDLYPEHLAQWTVLGPLGPLGDPMAALEATPVWSDPGPDREHPGADGPVSWMPGDRTSTNRFVRPQSVVYPRIGYAMIAAHFDVSAGGPAWLEVEAATRSSPRGNASWAWSLNGRAPRLVDRLTVERGRLEYLPVALVAGHNVLLVRAPLNVGLELAVRVLDAEGQPYPGLVEGGGSSAPPRPGDGAPPAGPLPVGLAGSEAALAALEQREPYAEAFLGWLQYLDGRQAEGLGHMRTAHAAAPTSAGIGALLSRCTNTAAYLPDVWRRNRARELAELVLAADPLRLDMGLAMADVLAGEDREEEALTLLDTLTEAHEGQADSLIARRSVHRSLGMTAQAEADLELALQRAPDHPAALKLLAAQLESVGQSSGALAINEHRMRSAGASAARLRSLAKDCLELGHLPRAEALLREAEARTGNRGFATSLVDLLRNTGRYAEAQAALTRILELYPRWAKQHVKRADIALLAGDREAELRALQEALALTPGSRPVRQRIEDLTGEHPTRRLQERYGVDRDVALGLHAEGDHEESVVRVLDSAVVQVFRDGTIETLTHNIVQVRDLDGCNAQGTQRLSGDVLKVVTIKADDRREIEPVKVGNGYVMPSLEPGDFVETITRSISNRPGDRVVRPGSWMFASESEPYVFSRYVIAIPRELPLRLVTRNFAGTHETHDEVDAVVHVFESHDRSRVLPEPSTPPRERYLPWIEFGADRDIEGSLANLTLETIAPRRVTPEVRARAAQLTDGVVGDEARARALYAFVGEHLDQRWGWGATATTALLMREGNPTYLYSALLAAVDIPHDVAWSRNQSPDSDPDPEPAFLDGRWWRGKLLVRVRPDDGPPAWCDLASRTMPYGHLDDDKPGAPVYLVDSGERTELPQLPLERRGPGLHMVLDFQLDTDLDAQVDASVAFVGGMGFTLKEPIQEIPDTFLKMAVGQVAGQIVPRIDVTAFELAGLDDDAPLSADVSGKIKNFLDDDGTQLSCKLPFPALELGAQFAGEGERKLPFFFGSSVVHTAVAQLRLPPELQLIDPPRGLSESFAGGRYSLTIEERPAGVWTVRRELMTPPIQLEAAEFGEFRELCARIDQAERARLRFARR